MNNYLFFNSESDDGVIDASIDLLDLYNGSLTLSESGIHRFYIGNEVPFNNIYFRVDRANSQTAYPSVFLWNGLEFVEAIGIRDATASGGATLAKSGHISWTTDPDEFWNIEEDTNNIPELTQNSTPPPRVLNNYWIRIDVPAAIDDTTCIDWIGHVFSNDDDLETEHPDLLLSKVLQRYDSSKDDFFELHVRGAEIVLNDLITQGLLQDAGQIFSYSQMRNLCVPKVSEIIYSSMGDPFFENARVARAEYEARRSKIDLIVDKNKDGHISSEERKVIKTTRLFR